MNSRLSFHWPLTLLLLCHAAGATAESVEVDADLLRRLQQTVEQQQEQLRLQAQTLDALQRQIESLRQAAPSAPAAAESRTAAQPSPPATTAQAAPSQPPSVKLKNKDVVMTLSGHVNPAVNIVDDGRHTDAYFVDNAVSGSRLNFVAASQKRDGLTLGARIEIGINPESTFAVSQEKKASGDSFSQRWTEVSMLSPDYGKLSLGKGDTASNTTAESDLSKTQAVQNSSIADLFSTMLFREAAGDEPLSDVKVSNVFFNLDGLHRQSRLRYDTPDFHGFSFATSMVSNRRHDAALFWHGRGERFQAIAAAAIAEPNIDHAGYRRDGSFSILHLASGLNLSLSLATQQRDEAPDDRNQWLKLGWNTRLNHYGETAFGIDYTKTQNMPEAGDSGRSYGIAAVQFLDEYSTELYLQYRRFTVDRESGPELSDLAGGTFGARFKF